MRYAIDEIIDDIAVLENIQTGMKKNVSIHLLPLGCREGNILIEKDDSSYSLDSFTEMQRRKIFADKLRRLKNLRKK